MPSHIFCQSRALVLSFALLVPAAFVACQKGGEGSDMFQEGNNVISDPCGLTVNPNGTTNGNQQVGLQPNTVSNVKPIAWPSLGFVNNPGGKDPKAVALSFDDAPDGSPANDWGKASPSNMSHVLDQLDALKVKATFFFVRTQMV